MQELAGRNFWNILGPEIRAKLLQPELDRQSHQNLPFSLEIPLMTKDGQNCWIKLNITELEIDSQKAILLFTFDITSRKQIEIELRRSETCFRQMAESVRDIFWVSNWDDGQLIYISPVYEEVYGRSREEMYHDSDAYLKYVHPQDKERILNRLRDPDLETDDEYRMIRPDGSLRWLRSKSFPVRDTSGKVYRTVGLTTDITEEKTLRNNLLNSQAQLMQAIKAIEGGLWEIDLSEYEKEHKLPNEIYISPELKALLGFEDHEFPSTIDAWNSRMHPDDLKRLDQMTLHHLRHSIDYHETEYRIRHKDGSWCWMYTRSRLREDENGKDIF